MDSRTGIVSVILETVGRRKKLQGDGDEGLRRWGSGLRWESQEMDLRSDNLRAFGEVGFEIVV